MINFLAIDNFKLILRFVCERDVFTFMNCRLVSKLWNKNIMELLQKYDKINLIDCFYYEDIIGVVHNYIKLIKSKELSNEMISNIIDFNHYLKLMNSYFIPNFFSQLDDIFSFALQFPRGGEHLADFFGLGEIRFIDKMYQDDPNKRSEISTAMVSNTFLVYPGWSHFFKTHYEIINEKELIHNFEHMGNPFNLSKIVYETLLTFLHSKNLLTKNLITKWVENYVSDGNELYEFDILSFLNDLNEKYIQDCNVVNINLNYIDIRILYKKYQTEINKKAIENVEYGYLCELYKNFDIIIKLQLEHDKTTFLKNWMSAFDDIVRRFDPYPYVRLFIDWNTCFTKFIEYLENTDFISNDILEKLSLYKLHKLTKKISSKRTNSQI